MRDTYFQISLAVFPSCSFHEYQFGFWSVTTNQILLMTEIRKYAIFTNNTKRTVNTLLTKYQPLKAEHAHVLFTYIFIMYLNSVINVT